MTKAEPHALHFLELMALTSAMGGWECVFAADGPGSVQPLQRFSNAKIVPVESKGYLESVLEVGVAACSGDFVFRLDDDEAMSPRMVAWLFGEWYKAADHWKFPRAHVWGMEGYAGYPTNCLMNPPLWPDHQTRLSVKAKSGGRHTVHAGSPFGGGVLAPVVIEHHKFVVKTAEERRAIAIRYDEFHPGYGTGGMKPFSLPEEVWTPEQRLVRPILEADRLAQEDAEKQPVS